MQQKLQQEAGALGNDIGKETQKTSPILKKCILYIY